KWSGQPDQVFGLSSWRSPGVLEDWEALIDAVDRGKVEQEIQDLLTGKKSEGGCEYRVRRPSGQRVWVKSRFQAMREVDGRTTRLLAVSGEIREHSSTISPADAQLIGDDASTESGDRLTPQRTGHPAAACESDQGDAVTDARARLLDLANDAIFIRSSDNKISYWNAGAERLYGWTKSEVLGRAPADFLKTEFPIPFEELSRRERWEGELRQRTRDGGMIVVSSRWSSLRDQEGRLTGWLEINTDMTRQKNAEAAARRLSARLLQMQDEERRRIARELHDSLGQYLTSLKINQDLLSRDESSMTSERRRTLLQESLEIIDQCLTETRTISHLLHPPLLDEAGFASAARWFVDGFAQRSGIQVDLELDPDLGRLPTEVEIALFRVLQETLTNVHRHSGSATAEIRLQIDAESVQLEVCDRGLGISQEQLRGFRRATPEVGIGLAGMRERIRELGGTLELRSGSTGTTITVIVPLHEQAIAASDSAR
ncbi:MAG: PAS domain-containing protein, partial [Acidobacteriales bacterium]|nr:PAS domain-containing protein [Terriglobales bacterium]